MNQSNAARRLCNILEQAINTENPDQPIYQTLAEVIGIEEPNEERSEFIEFFVLIAEVERAVRQLKNVQNLRRYTNAIEEIHSVFLSNGFYTEKWIAISTILKHRNLISILESCADLIAQQQPDPSLSEEQLQEYLQQCEDLLHEMANSDLDNDIKTFLIVRFEEICTAIRHYKLGGPERLRTVVEANIGAVILRSDRISTSDREKPLFNKIFGWLMNLGAVLDLAANTQGYLLPKVVEVVKNLLPPG